MKKRHSAEQIVGMLRQADVELGKGQKVPEVCRQLGVSAQTYYRWHPKVVLAMGARTHADTYLQAPGEYVGHQTPRAD